MTAIRCPYELPAGSILDASTFDRLHAFAGGLADESSKIDGIGGVDRATSEQLSDLIRHAQQVVELANDARDLAVEAAREHAWSWQEVGDAFGISRQSAHERFAR